MRIASFNVENLFNRVKVMNRDNWEDGKQVLDLYARFNKIICKEKYSAADKAKIAEILTALGLAKSDDTKLVVLRQNHEKLVRRPKGGGIEVIAEGRDEWIGWLELKVEPVDAAAIENTARIIHEVDADILAVIEAEDRIALLRFSDQMLERVGATPYPHTMLIDGNDERGIDVGVLTKQDYALNSICSHVDDRDGQGLVFSRDCPEYEVQLPSGDMLLVLVNHLKSKGFGSQATSNARRKRQAERIKDIYDRRRAKGRKLIAVVGDLNDTPDSDPLSPLLGNGSDLKDVSEHPKWQDDGFPGTWGNGNASGKIDYILLSPELYQKVTAAGVNRKGVWGGKNGDRWEILPTITRKVEAASDHAAIWADLNA
jgi:endonuclease/exonuclease/phosphatase family metal-dependent hydrolase